MPDADGYPTEEELVEIEKWPGLNKASDYKGLMARVKELWHYPDRFVEKENDIYYLSTGGWSGNESIIHALRDNYLFWAMCWLSSRRGGHYEFEVKELRANTTEGSGDAR